MSSHAIFIYSSFVVAIKLSRPAVLYNLLSASCTNVSSVARQGPIKPFLMQSTIELVPPNGTGDKNKS